MIWPPVRFSYNTHNLDLPVAGALAADLAADRRRSAGSIAERDRRHRLPRHRMELARHRRPGPRRGRAPHLRLPHLGAVRAHPCRSISSVIGVARRRRAGLFRRLDRSRSSSASSRSGPRSPRSISSSSSRRSSRRASSCCSASCCCSPGSRSSASCAPSSCAPAISSTCAPPARSASPTATIMFKHLLPNAMVATLTFLPFILNGSITTLTSLDFLGFGLPPGSPSLGELLAQGKANLQAPWLGLTGFFIIASCSRSSSSSARRCATPSIRARRSNDRPAPLGRRPVGRLPPGRARHACGRPHLVRHHARRDRGARRRVRIGQVGLGALDPEAPALSRRRITRPAGSCSRAATSSPRPRTRCGACAATTSPWSSRSR